MGVGGGRGREMRAVICDSRMLEGKECKPWVLWK